MDSETKKNVVFTGLRGSWMLSNGHRMQTRILAPKRKVVGSNPARNDIVRGARGACGRGARAYQFHMSYKKAVNVQQNS